MIPQPIKLFFIRLWPGITPAFFYKNNHKNVLLCLGTICRALKLDFPTANLEADMLLRAALKAQKTLLRQLYAVFSFFILRGKANANHENAFFR